jgi:hypothetical protein
MKLKCGANLVSASMRHVLPQTGNTFPRSERIAGRGQGSQLATGSEGRLPPDAAHVLAER